MRPSILSNHFIRCSALALLILFLSGLQACKKEYTDYPYHVIEQFSIKTDAESSIDGVIKGDTILIYWPPFTVMPEVITPNISVSERATVSPASGVEVPLSDKTVYTVTAQDGSLQKYTLKPVNNQPKPTLELNSVATTLVRGARLTLKGTYFINDLTQTKLFIVDKDKRETPIAITALTAATILAKVPSATEIELGTYTFKLVTGTRTVSTVPYEVIR